jgi:hypothetical protein
MNFGDRFRIGNLFIARRGTGQKRRAGDAYDNQGNPSHYETSSQANLSQAFGFVKEKLAGAVHRSLAKQAVAVLDDVNRFPRVILLSKQNLSLRWQSII